ncbi:Smr domain-containing [Hyphodiscus hymeniophilus]|uniref:Smr domain-containing n=1 Tax=Hyphodiscus hymeniophilus TaxID=353542 RepID=A0A9P6SKF2_9HELO|nr:Smr domain-containing [Hyphodiscus hymeniophilus]
MGGFAPTTISSNPTRLCAMVDAEDLRAQLINEFGSTLETSLVFAILSDYDLSDSSQLQETRYTLEQLQKSAREEEESGFDASASSGAYPCLNNREESQDGSGSGKSLPGWSSSTDDTELSHGFAPPSVDPSSASDLNGEGTTYGDGLDSLDRDSKESMLVEMFPGLKPFDIQWTLKKDVWDMNRSINDLMTQTFMEEIGARQRGIEAFSEPDLLSPVRKGKVKKRNKKTKNRLLDDLNSPITPESPTGSKWDTGKQDVEFIATRTGKSDKEIGSLYHKNGASIRTTIRAVLDAQLLSNAKYDDPLIESTAIDLGHEFPSLSKDLLLPLVQVTHPSTAHAHELAKALIYQPISNKSNIQIEFRHAPLELDVAIPKPKASTASNLGLTLDTANTLAARYTKEREDAFTQARAAYRKGKSDHLMGGAAAYYSEVGRTADSRLKSAQSAAADTLAASQSSKSQLDLHGLNVQDGRRIAKERVTNWWHELGESRISGRGGATEYRIITGVGYHSEGGKSKLAPAILKMLMQDGWKVQVGTGFLVVTGIAKKK